MTKSDKIIQEFHNYLKSQNAELKNVYESDSKTEEYGYITLGRYDEITDILDAFEKIIAKHSKA